MTWKISVLLLAALSTAAPASAQHSSSEPVLDVSAMDRTIDPCVDFYAYSCGGWIKKNQIPPDQASWGTYVKLEDDNRAQLRTILEEAGKANGSGGAVKRDGTDEVTQNRGEFFAS